MFIGHFALGLGAKRVAPAVSLGMLFLAVQFADVAWPWLVLAGVERFAIVPGITVVTPVDFEWYPYSHSLVAMIGWGVAIALIYKALRRSVRPGAVLTVGLLVVSHWILDVIAHRPDLPVTIGGDSRFGLELWASRGATIAVEMLMFAAGLALYMRSTKAVDRIGSWALYGLVAFLLLINVANMFGPPPPSASAVAWSAQALWLLVAWGYWIDKHRRAVTANPSRE